MFLKENLLPIEAAGQLRFLRDNTQVVERASDFNFEVFYADGHTEKQMLPMIQYQGKIYFNILIGHTNRNPSQLGQDNRRSRSSACS